MCLLGVKAFLWMWQWPWAEFNATINQDFHFVSESQKGWGSGKGKVKGGGIRTLIHELVVNTLTPRLWCSVFMGPRLMCVRLRYRRPGWWVLQTEPELVHRYLNSRSAWVEAISPRKMPRSPEQIDVINVVDPLQTPGFAERRVQS